ncbi:MAG: type IV pilus biogenesis protein PilP [Alphaproteobacteria bacterium]|nr:type IV pilus biogenesis protein PilP [Alphaproteobacteria bacterium]
MQNKKINMFGFFVIGAILCAPMAHAEEVVEIIDEEIDMGQVSANAVENYQVEGSLFQQITDLEQEKILMQLEKERAQLDLELDRLAAEKIKLHMEIDTLSGRAEQQQQEIETQKAKLEAEAARIEREKEAWLAEAEQEKTVRKAATASSTPRVEEEKPEVDITKKYRLVNVIGAGSQLQATIEDLSSGQTKRVNVGKKLDGFTIKSISLDDGVVVVGEDGITQNLNISNGK